MNERPSLKITLFDPSVCTGNLGDAIIMDCARKQIKNVFPGSFVTNVQTHDILGDVSHDAINKSDYAIVCGTNLLSSNMNKYNQWKINLIDSFKIKNIILMGVGWWQYQSRPNFYTKYLLRKILHANCYHSVRDNYALDKLESAGIKNVINTGCVTLWDLTPEHIKCIPEEKGEEVLMTFTDYNQRFDLDCHLYNVLSKYYRKIYFWIQGARDYEYARKIVDSNNVEFIDPNLAALDQLLASNISLDYVGTRLHAGIRALQYKRRAVILSVDNRAKEKGTDFSLPVIERENLDGMEKMIVNPVKIKNIVIPYQSIDSWKQQFIINK